MARATRQAARMRKIDGLREEHRDRGGKSIRAANVIT